MKMTPDQINRAIAELCGTIRVDRIEADKEAGAIITYTKCPDYFHDLNACAEFERTMENQFTTDAERYWRLLESMAPDHPHVIFATAPQRCEAFLRLHGKWTE